MFEDAWYRTRARTPPNPTGCDRLPGIATAMYLSQSTVCNHLATVYRRLGVHSQADLLSLLRSRAALRERVG